jgi:hypothetical protein
MKAKRSPHVFPIVGACFLLLFTCSLFAQETGEILGKVTDDEGVGLPGVTVTATSPSLQGKRSALSDTNGSIRLSLLPMGVYKLVFELKGFTVVTQENVEVKLGQVTSTKIVLQPATLEAQVTVVAEAPLIDKTKSDTSYNLNSKELAQIPVQGRTINEVMNYTPGVTGVRHNTTVGTGGGGTQFGAGSFRGEGASGNNWLVDGLSKRGATEHSSGVKVNFDAWDEVQIISDGFSPELGSTYGGIINIVTKSGGNSFHGEVGGLVWDHNLRSDRQPQLSIAVEPVTSQYNVFGNVGGPIITDKLWFFLSDNLWRTADDNEGGQIGWLAVPPGKKRVNTNNVFGKVTYALFENHTIFASGTYDSFLSQSGGFGLPELYTKYDYTDYAYRLNYKGILGPNTLLEAAVGRSSRDQASVPVSGNMGPAQFFYNDINQATKNAFSRWGTVDQRTDFTSRFTQYLNTEKFGNHEFGLGISYYNMYYKSYDELTGKDWLIAPTEDYWTGGAYITFDTLGYPAQLSQYRNLSYYNKGNGWSFYLKDKITFGRLSLMLGLRSESQQIYDDLDSKVDAISWGWSKFLSPRFSLSWDVTGDGVNVLKFGLGRFSDTMIWDVMGQFTRNGSWTFVMYHWKGPLPTSEDDTAALKDINNWEYNWQQGGPGELQQYKQVRPGTGPDFLEKAVLEYDRRLGPNWALKLRGIVSRHENMLEDLGFFSMTDAWYELMNWEEKRRNYWGIEVELNGRIGEKFFLNSSYSRSSAKGSTPGDSEYIGNYEWYMYNTNGCFGDHFAGPADSPYADYAVWSYGFGGWGYGDEGWYGYLPYSCDHVVKVLGTYSAPYGIMVSANAEYYKGYHWSIWGFQTGYWAYCYLPHGRGTETIPGHMYVDLSVEKDFRLTGGVSLGVRLNVTNVLNSQQPVSYGSGEGSTFYRQVWGRQYPRWIQLQAHVRF